MQNTMVRGRNGQPGKKMKLGVKKKNEKGERKNEENYIKNGEKALKVHLFWVINSENFNLRKENVLLTISAYEKISFCSDFNLFLLLNRLQ